MSREPTEKKFCGTCRWYKETRAFAGECLRYQIATRMESYRFNCRDWVPVALPPSNGNAF